MSHTSPSHTSAPGISTGAPTAPIDLHFSGDIAPAARERVAAALQSMRQPGPWQAEVLDGGASNTNFKLRNEQGQFVLRIAEPDIERFGVDRRGGCAAHEVAALVGVAPRLTALVLPEGHCLSELAPGGPLDTQTIRAPGRLAAIGRMLRRLHEAPAADATFSPFRDVRWYTNIARREHLPLPADFPELIARLDELESGFKALQTPPALCHNDLVAQNFVATDDQIVLVDWEYAGMGDPYFDLGNLSVNAALEPGERDDVLAAYFGRAPTPAEAARVDLMRVVSALREACWAVVADPVLQHDFDYAAWGAKYFADALCNVRSAPHAARVRLAFGTDHA